MSSQRTSEADLSSIVESNSPDKIIILETMNRNVILSIPKATDNVPATTGWKYMNKATLEDSTKPIA